MESPPSWTQALNAEDWQFLKRFLLESGSLKALAQAYGISYPTVRQRLDRLIAKTRAVDAPGPSDAFHRQLRVMLAEDRLTREAARALLDAHRKTLADKGLTEDAEEPKQGGHNHA